MQSSVSNVSELPLSLLKNSTISFACVQNWYQRSLLPNDSLSLLKQASLTPSHFPLNLFCQMSQSHLTKRIFGEGIKDPSAGGIGGMDISAV
jgi:hypothetical protein